jgi:hypothetical protein
MANNEYIKINKSAHEVTVTWQNIVRLLRGLSQSTHVNTKKHVTIAPFNTTPKCVVMMCPHKTFLTHDSTCSFAIANHSVGVFFVYVLRNVIWGPYTTWR